MHVRGGVKIYLYVCQSVGSSSSSMCVCVCVGGWVGVGVGACVCGCMRACVRVCMCVISNLRTSKNHVIYVKLDLSNLTINLFPCCIKHIARCAGNIIKSNNKLDHPFTHGVITHSAKEIEQKG